MRPLFLLLCLLIVPMARAQESDAPYVYYQAGSALHVERADGTGRHLLTDAIMGGEIGWSAWSPSGQWFAWTAIDYDPYGEPGISKPGAVRVDGQRVTVLDDFLSAELSWSPTDDLLMAVGVVEEHSALVTDFDSALYRLTLIDPAEDQILSSVNVIQTTVSGGIPFATNSYRQSTWTPDGRYFMFYYQQGSREFPELPGTVEIFDTALKTVTTIEHLGSPYMNDPFGQAFQLLPNGRLIFELTDGLGVISIVGGCPLLNTVDLGASLYALSWNHDTSAVLALLEDGSLWELEMPDSCETPTTQQLTGNALFGEDMPFWSPDGQYAAFMNDGYTLYIFDRSDDSVQQVAEGAADWRWQSNSVLEILKYDGNEIRYGLYDVERRLPLETRFTTSAENFDDVSASGHYLAGVDSDSPWIFDLETGQERRVSPHGRTILSSDYMGSIRWHPSEDWFLTQEIPFIPMMGFDPTNVAVVAVDGTVRRDLTRCIDALNCVQWLPPQVNPADIPNLENPTLEPEIVLTDQDFVTELLWSPDSRFVASFTSDGYAVWDVNTAALVERLEVPDAQDFTLTWNTDEQGNLIPELTPFNYEYAGHLTALNTSADGRWEAEINPDFFSISAIQLQNRSTGERIPFDEVGYAAAFSPDGQYLAVGAAWEIRIYRLESIIQTKNSAS